ncbi:PEP-CTERM sorting domain-containing protein [Hyella patelloides]|nr:PEP-CTERM sorting domain-containing protein [Hyella patelloides]
MKNILTFGLATGALLIASTQAQAATMTTVIDNFNDTIAPTGVQLDVSPIVTSDSNTEMGLSGVLGGKRTSELTFLDGDAAAQANINQFFTVNSGTANLSNNAAGFGQDGASSNLNLKYDGFGIEDFSSFDFAAIDIELESVTDDFAAISVTFKDNGGNMVTSMADGRIEDVILPSPTTFLFSEFTGDASFSFANVTEISLDVSGFDEEDIVIDNFRVEGEKTPEPAAVLGLLLSLGCGALSKKKKQA